MAKIIKFLFFLAVTLLVFYLIFQKIDYSSLGAVLFNVKLPYLAAGLSIVFLSPVILAKKWQAMLKAMDYFISFKDSLRIIMAACPVSIVSPAKSGDLIRAYYLRDRIPPTKTMGAVTTERLIDVSVLSFYSFLGAVILGNRLILAISLSIILLIFLFFLVINKIKLPPGKWQERIESFLALSKIFGRQPKKLLSILPYAFLIWLVPIFEAKILFLAFGVNVPLLYIAAAFPLAIFVALIPITVAGMGTRDSAIIYLFSAWASPSVCLAVGLLYALFAYWLLALIGLPIMKKLL